MAKTYSDLFMEVRDAVKLMTLEELKQRFDKGDIKTLVDVREKDEFRGGFIPGATHIPRGFLEMQAENKLPDKSAEVIVYCAGGTRSAFAAKTLAELGYSNVVSVNPGFIRWKDMSWPVETPPELTSAQLDRYSRHLLLPEVGEKGQEKLLKARVLLLGAGGLGSPSSLYLAAAGVGTLGLIDADVVDASNLQRQIVHATSRVGMPKVDSAEQALRDLNPDVKIIKYQERLTSENIERILADNWDVIVDGVDNFPTRYLVNDASVFHNIPVVHGSIFRFDGQVTTFIPHQGPCYRCLYPEPPPPHLAPSCAEAGVLGILPGTIGVLQATEAVKLILDRGNNLSGRLLTYDSLGMTFRTLKLRKDKHCPVCGENPTIKEYIDYEGFCSGG
ncbi:MAG: molybdopterin-synthase adenylyltransferase MoeB [Polyangiaceae bacterium]|nr:molybdopterin-synthase adenylyltransferase MoeB [Myxococcales bacterium]MCB9584212.1 molybdopterin-synthase adenylyltransferase MoeB [Polyangiaceae bacterium]MCB9608626.1 molybdopterin-synthase adenylyltransferase MoeB [Polyangiaceae bacterium]